LLAQLRRTTRIHCCLGDLQDCSLLWSSKNHPEHKQNDFTICDQRVCGCHQPRPCGDRPGPDVILSACEKSLESSHRRKMSICRPSLLRHCRCKHNMRLVRIFSAIRNSLPSAESQSRHSTSDYPAVLWLPHNNLLCRAHDPNQNSCAEWRLYAFDSLGSDRSLHRSMAMCISKRRNLPLTQLHRS